MSVPSIVIAFPMCRFTSSIAFGAFGIRYKVVCPIRTRNFKLKLAAGLEDVPAHNDARLLRRKAVLPNSLPELLDRKSIARLELYSRQSLVQTHIHALHSGELFESSAHGEGTSHSIHAKDGQIELKQFGACRLQCQNDRE